MRSALTTSFARHRLVVRDICEAGSGAGSQVYRVATDGELFAVKVAMYPERHDQVIREFTIRKSMVEHGFDFVPPPRWTDEESFADGAAVYDYIEGQAIRSVLGANGGMLTELLHGLAEMLAQLHVVDLRVVNDGFSLAQEMLARTNDLIDRTIKRHGSLVNDDLDKGLRRAFDEVQRAVSELRSSFTIGLIGRCHDDVAGNVIVGENGKLWLIDWENSTVEDIVEELVSVSHDLRLSESQGRTFFERYQERFPAARGIDFSAMRRAYDLPNPICNICYSIDFLDVNLRRSLKPDQYADSLIGVARSTVGTYSHSVSKLLVRGAQRTSVAVGATPSLGATEKREAH